MASGTELAKAYVQIVPSAQGMKKALTDILGENMPSGDEPGRRIGGGITRGIGSVIQSGASVIGNAVAGVAKASAAVAVTTFTAAAGGVAALTKQAVSAYADYEQLVGGVETLFKTSADSVLAYAEEAYKTAGLSANEYMETVTSFSASLLQGLDGDTAKAAEVANQAITDMSDNANKMGSSMEAIQNAYQGFAKQNYTMLDNLKLGYGGTASEMARLVNDSGILGDITVDAKTLNETVSFDQIIEAIHVIQTEMDITGTTAREAEGTISGSLSMVKSSWTNLVAGLGNKDANISQLVSQFTASVTTFGKNVIPIAKQALSGIGSMLKELVPEIVSAIPELAQEVIPELATTISELMPELITAFEQIVSALIEQIPVLLPILIEGAIQLFQGIISAFDQITAVLLPMLPELISQVVTALKTMIPQLISSGFELLMGLVEGIAENADEIVDAILDLIPQIIDTITENLPRILEAGGKILFAIVTGIGDHLPEIVQAAVDLVAALLAEIVLHLPEIVESGADMLGSIASGILEALGSVFSPLGEALSSIFNSIKDFFSGCIDNWEDIGGDIIEGIVDGFLEGWETLKGAVTDDFVDNWVTGFKDIFGIHSPSKVMKDQIGKNLALGLTEGFEDEFSASEDEIGNHLKKSFTVTAAGAAPKPDDLPKPFDGRGDPGGRVIVLRLVDNFGRLIAEGTVDDIDQLQGEEVVLSERWLA